MTQLMLLWVVLGVITLALALYRVYLSKKEDVYVHVSEGEERLIPQQVATYERIGRVERWGITLTIITVAGGLALACAYLYQAATSIP